MGLLKKIGVVAWALLGVFFAIIILSWGKYILARESLASVIVLIPLVGIISLFLIYLFITFGFKIFHKNKR